MKCAGYEINNPHVSFPQGRWNPFDEPVKGLKLVHDKVCGIFRWLIGNAYWLKNSKSEVFIIKGSFKRWKRDAQKPKEYTFSDFVIELKNRVPAKIISKPVEPPKQSIEPPTPIRSEPLPKPQPAPTVTYTPPKPTGTLTTSAKTHVVSVSTPTKTEINAVIKEADQALIAEDYEKAISLYTSVASHDQSYLKLAEWLKAHPDFCKAKTAELNTKLKEVVEHWKTVLASCHAYLEGYDQSLKKLEADIEAFEDFIANPSSSYSRLGANLVAHDLSVPFTTKIKECHAVIEHKRALIALAQSSDPLREEMRGAIEQAIERELQKYKKFVLEDQLERIGSYPPYPESYTEVKAHIASVTELKRLLRHWILGTLEHMSAYEQMKELLAKLSPSAQIDPPFLDKLKQDLAEKRVSQSTYDALITLHRLTIPATVESDLATQKFLAKAPQADIVRITQSIVDLQPQLTNALTQLDFTQIEAVINQILELIKQRDIYSSNKQYTDHYTSLLNTAKGLQAWLQAHPDIPKVNLEAERAQLAAQQQKINQAANAFEATGRPLPETVQLCKSRDSLGLILKNSKKDATLLKLITAGHVTLNTHLNDLAEKEFVHRTLGLASMAIPNLETVVEQNIKLFLKQIADKDLRQLCIDAVTQYKDPIELHTFLQPHLQTPIAMPSTDIPEPDRAVVLRSLLWNTFTETYKQERGNNKFTLPAFNPQTLEADLAKVKQHIDAVKGAAAPEVVAWHSKHLKLLDYLTKKSVLKLTHEQEQQAIADCLKRLDAVDQFLKTEAKGQNEAAFFQKIAVLSSNIRQYISGKLTLDAFEETLPNKVNSKKDLTAPVFDSALPEGQYMERVQRYLAAQERFSQTRLDAIFFDNPSLKRAREKDEELEKIRGVATYLSNGLIEILKLQNAQIKFHCNTNALTQSLQKPQIENQIADIFNYLNACKDRITTVYGKTIDCSQSVDILGNLIVDRDASPGAAVLQFTHLCTEILQKQILACLVAADKSRPVFPKNVVEVALQLARKDRKTTLQEYVEMQKKVPS